MSPRHPTKASAPSHAAPAVITPPPPFPNPCRSLPQVLFSRAIKRFFPKKLHQFRVWVRRRQDWAAIVLRLHFPAPTRLLSTSHYPCFPQVRNNEDELLPRLIGLRVFPFTPNW